jgi:prepilin-type N-terminal cleavage/methylation domain-containing protein
MARGRHNTSTNQRGFTLVELLVVIAIIGVLVALLLPAVQAAREASRRSQCSNHLKQIGLGWLTHESTHKFFPSGGWSPWVVGDADMGAGAQQPGGWMYQILPYIEQQALYKLPGDGKRDVITPEQRKAAVQLQGTPVPTFHCPTRRPPQAFPWTVEPAATWTPKNSDRVQLIVCGDFAANGGDNKSAMAFKIAGGDTLTESDDAYPPNLGGAKWVFPPFKGYYGAASKVTDWPPLTSQSGVNFTGSEIEIRHISDGVSNTYMVGEKNLDPDCYEGTDPTPNDTGAYGCGGDGQGYFVGFDWDTHRFAMDVPVQDTPGADPWRLFGSAHPTSWHVVLCDGAVRAVSYDIDADTHRFLANRLDGQTLGPY